MWSTWAGFDRGPFAPKKSDVTRGERSERDPPRRGDLGAHREGRASTEGGGEHGGARVGLELVNTRQTKPEQSKPPWAVGLYGPVRLSLSPPQT